MRNLTKWKVSLLEWIFRRLGLGFFLLLHGEEDCGDKVEHQGCALCDGEDKEHLCAILQSTVDNVPDVRQLIFDAIIPYLKRYEVDCNNFLAELKKD